MLCYFGHHKCGTGWIRNIIQDISKQSGWKNTTVYDVNESCHGQTLDMYLKQEKIDFLCYTNADIDEVHKLNGYKAFHVIRDPRDIVVSAYFSHLHSHTIDGWPELALHREKLQRMSKDDGLLIEMEFIKPFLNLLGKWNYDNPNVFEIKMEDLTAEPEKRFLEIFNFLGILKKSEPSVTERLIMAVNPFNQKGRGTLPFGWPVSPIRIQLERIPGETVRRTVDANSFSRLSGGRKPGEENVASHYRKGKAGDWINHFKTRHIEHFSEIYDDLLEKLGYE